MTQERFPYSHVSPLRSPGRLQSIPAQRFPVERTGLRSTGPAQISPRGHKLLERGMPIEQMQKFRGHSKLETTHV
jgi:hypothetical protein